jgi:hypothetical protein
LCIVIVCAKADLNANAANTLRINKLLVNVLYIN